VEAGGERGVEAAADRVDPVNRASVFFDGSAYLFG
jgi:hypothetical protein